MKNNQTAIESQIITADAVQELNEFHDKLDREQEIEDVIEDHEAAGGDFPPQGWDSVETSIEDFMDTREDDACYDDGWAEAEADAYHSQWD
jgi:hypothetical protein